MCNKTFLWDVKILKLVDQFTYLGSSISSTESTIYDIDRLLIIWKSDLFNKIKWEFFPAVAGITATIWLHHLDLWNDWEKNKLDGNYNGIVPTIWEIVRKFDWHSLTWGWPRFRTPASSCDFGRHVVFGVKHQRGLRFWRQQTSSGSLSKNVLAAIKWVPMN